MSSEMLLNFVFVTYNWILAWVVFLCFLPSLSFLWRKDLQWKSLRIQGGLFLTSTRYNNRPPWIFRQIVQAPLNFFCWALTLSLIWKRPPWFSYSIVYSPPENKKAKLMPPWKQKSKIYAPLNFEQQKQMSNPPKNSHFYPRDSGGPCSPKVLRKSIARTQGDAESW